MKLSEKRYSVEKEERWRELCKKIPAINFRDEWRVMILPPWSGALVRFHVEKHDIICSVFLDFFEDSALGLGAKPGWDVHTTCCGQPERFELWDVESVRGCIEAKLELANVCKNKDRIVSSAEKVISYCDDDITDFKSGFHAATAIIKDLLTLIKINED